MRHRSVLLSALLIAAALASAPAQRRPPVPPPITLPDVTRDTSDRGERPQFRVAVTRVEVSALVLDANNKPVRGLTQADFEILENGVPQRIRSFEPFTFERDLVSLPDPVPERADPLKPAPAPASNYYTSSSRIFALILDDLHVDVRRTRVARDAARRLVQQLAPADLLLVMQTGSGESSGHFSRDRQHALRMIEEFAGQRLPNKTTARMRFPGHDYEAERADHYERLCATIRDMSMALRDVTGRRKTVILISEGSSFGAGMSDMTVEMPTPTNNLRANTPTGMSRVMNDALAAAAAGNVAIYPLNPAGLDVADADLIQAPGLVRGELTPQDYSEILTEARQGHEMARDLAALTGGVSLVDTNDPLAGVDRAVRDASVHYVLSYEPPEPPKGSEYRRIDVKVRRSGLRVLARRGYRNPGAVPPPPMKVPDSLSPQLRTLLSGVMPDDGLPMRVHAVPVARSGRTATVAVVVEINGTMLAAQRGSRALKIEQGLLTVNDKGRPANGTRRTLDVALSPAQWDVLAATGLRTMWALDLAPGRYQVRVASVDAAANRGGSVYFDLDVPKPAAGPRDVLMASRLLSMMPTPFTDKRLAAWTAVMPTATRVFPRGDVLTVTVGSGSPGTIKARLSNAAGQPVWQSSPSAPESGSAGQVTVPLDVEPGIYDLTLETAGAVIRTTIGIVAPG